MALVGVAIAALAGLRAAAAPPDAGARKICIPRLLPCPPPPASAPKPPALAIGLTEADPRMLTATRPGSPGARAVALRPRYVRVLVDWNRVQPRAGHEPNWDAPPGGCPASAPRCATDRGLRGLLETLKARRKADGVGWQIMVVPYFTPAWAAMPARGCERPGTKPRARMPRIAAYVAFLRALQRLGDDAGVELAYWAPWNEPNHPGFLNPQRETCDVASPALAPALYAQLVRAAVEELRSGQRLVIGELAGLDTPRPYGASAPEFIRELPPDVACAGSAFAQHVYIGERGRGGLPPLVVDPATAASDATSLVDSVDAAMLGHGCHTPLWITETGTFDHRCESMAAALEAWSDDPRVDAAFQYTFRESRAFPVGLVSPSLRTTYGSYTAWHAFSRSRDDAPPSPCG